MKHSILFFLIFLGFTLTGCDQTADNDATATSENKSLHGDHEASEKGEGLTEAASAGKNSIRAKHNLKDHYNFTELWIWEYVDYYGEKGDVWVYRDPESGYWLFTQDAYGNTDGMSDWIMGLTNGTYFLGYVNPEMGSKKQILELKTSYEIDDELLKLWKKTNITAPFGQSAHSMRKFTGTAYEVTYPKLSDRSRIYVAETEVDFRPIYYFNNLDSDARLPIHFPSVLSKNQFALADSSVMGDGTMVTYTFKEVSPNQYHVQLNEYDN